ARLARDRRLGAVRVRRAALAAVDAAVVPAHEHAAFLVDRGVEEVEHVAAVPAMADRTALDRRARRDVLRGPGLAAVERRRDVEIPDAGEETRIVAGPAGVVLPGSVGRGGAVERERRAIRVAGNHRGKHDVL